MHSTKFTSGEVQKLTGFPAANLRVLRQRYQLPFSRGGTWGGDASASDAPRWERFSRAEVAQLACMRNLMLLGIPVSDSCHIMRDSEVRDAVVSEMLNMGSAERTFVLAWPALVEGEHEYIVCNDRKVFEQIGHANAPLVHVVLDITSTCRRIKGVMQVLLNERSTAN